MMKFRAMWHSEQAFEAASYEEAYRAFLAMYGKMNPTPAVTYFTMKIVGVASNEQQEKETER